MGTTEETSRHFVIFRPKTGGREQKTVISFGPSQNCCRTESTVGEVQAATKSGCLILREAIPDGWKVLSCWEVPTYTVTLSFLAA
jgi:hypothetical protein